MQEQIKSINPYEREKFLQDHADVIVEGEYFKSFDENELQNTQTELSDAMVKLNRKENEFNNIKEEFKIHLKPLKKDVAHKLANIQANGEYLDGKLYLFANQDNGMMESFDKFGHLVSSRRLKPEERQMNILSISKAN